jgi:hypothetical protein
VDCWRLSLFSAGESWVRRICGSLRDCYNSVSDGSRWRIDMSRRRMRRLYEWFR